MVELNAKKVTQVAPGVIDGVDGAVFSVEGTDGGTFAIASKRKELKQLMRSDADVIYDTKNSKLFLNESGTKQGWGKRKIGGLIGRLKGKPQLSSEHFEGLTAHNDAGSRNPALLTTGVIRHTPFDPIRFLSLSGGGWNTHSNLAGVFAASMDWQKTNNKSRDIADLLSKYNYISANSGGTWFLTHLGFSPDYVDSLTNEDRANSYTTNGFIGNVKQAFGEIEIPLQHRLSSITKMNYIANSEDTFNANWAKLVKELVYDPIMKGMKGKKRDNNNISTKKFEGSNLAEWATGKHLTYATTLTKRSQMAAEARGNYVAPAVRVPLAKLSRDGLILNANYAYGGYVGPYPESTLLTKKQTFTLYLLK